MTNKHETLKSLFDDIAVAIRGTSPITEDIVADNFPAYVRAGNRTDCPATPSDLLSCSDSFIEWVVQNNLQQTFWGGDFTFLRNLPTVSFSVSNKRIPGVAYDTTTDRYYSVGSDSTNIIDDCYVYILNNDLTQEKVSTAQFTSTTLFSNHPSCVEVVDGYCIAGFNGNTKSATLNRAFFSFPIPASVSSNIQGNGWRNSAILYQVNASAKADNGSVYFYGSYSTAAGSAAVFSVSSGSLSSSSHWGLGNVSENSPFIAASSYNGYPVTITQRALLVLPLRATINNNGSGSYKKCQLGSSEEGIDLFTVGDYLVACTKVSDGNYKLYFGSNSNPESFSKDNFMVGTCTKPVKGIFYVNELYILIYEDGTTSVRKSLNSNDIFSRSIVSYSNVSIRETQMINNKIIITGWEGTNLENSFVSYYSL